MDLKTFVADSLKQIAGGIREAQEADTGATICPRIRDLKTMEIAAGANTHTAQSVSFDVAVSVVESGAGGGSIKVAWLEIGGEISSGTSSSSLSRIRFDIPVVWPKPKPKPTA